MKVYVLRSHCSYKFSTEVIEGVFSTREKALLAQEILEIDGLIEEKGVDEIHTKGWHPIEVRERGEIIEV
jgi:hypothetical protein